MSHATMNRLATAVAVLLPNRPQMRTDRSGGARPTMNTVFIEHVEAELTGSPRRGLEKRNFMECGAGIAPLHSGLMPEALITLAHFSASWAMCLANSAGEFGGIATAPSSARRFLIVGSPIAALNSLLSVSMMVPGVFFGTSKPSHATWPTRSDTHCATKRAVISH